MSKMGDVNNDTLALMPAKTPKMLHKWKEDKIITQCYSMLKRVATTGPVIPRGGTARNNGLSTFKHQLQGVGTPESINSDKNN